MKRLSRFIGAGLAVVVVFGLWSAAPAREPARDPARDPDQERLLGGDVLISFKENPQSKVHDVQGEILLDAPPSLVWWVLTDYQNWAAIYPDMTGCEVIERKDNTARLKVSVNNLWPYPDFNYTLAITEDPVNWTMSWTMEDGNLKNFYGSAGIKYFELDTAKTRLTYLVNRNQGWFVPRMNADLDNRTMIINRLMAVRQEVRNRKKILEATPTDSNLKPKWWKEPFWWEKAKPEDNKDDGKGDERDAPPPDEKPKQR